MRKEIILPGATLAAVGALFGLWHVAYHVVSRSTLALWAVTATLLALALPPFVGLICWRWGHSKSDGMVQGIQEGTRSVSQQATRTASLGLRTRLAARTIMAVEKPEEELPPLPSIQCFGSSDDVGLLEDWRKGGD